METIKKYENRKLYSLSLNKYVKLSYIKDLVKTDQKFQVIDNKTNIDITNKIILDTLLNSLPSMDLNRSSIEALLKSV